MAALRILTGAALLLAQGSPAPGQYRPTDGQSAQQFPLTLNVIDSKIDDLSGGPGLRIQGEQLGMAADIFIRVTATINGESHWWISCGRENSLGETNPCTQLARGEYPARWIHNGEILQVVVRNDKDGLEWRLLDVLPKLNDPPSSTDPVVQAPHFQFEVSVPNGKKPLDYPLLIHVYGATSLQLPRGSLPVHTRCTSTTYSSYTTHIDCTNSGGIQLYSGYVVLYAAIDGSQDWNISCDVNWRWSKCAALGPGFYPARWTDKKKDQLSVLACVGDKAREITFRAEHLALPNTSEPTPARPPSP